MSCFFASKCGVNRFLKTLIGYVNMIGVQDMKENLESYTKATMGQKVTVFLLSSNREAYIGSAIEGVLRQTYKNFQLVILDNFSTDKTEEIVKSFSDERIHFIQRHSPVESPNYRYAFHICSTKYLVILHDDDIIEETYLEKVLKKIEENHFVAVSTSARIIDENGFLTGGKIKTSDDIVYEGDMYLEKFFSATPVSIVFPTAIYEKEYYGELENFFNISAGQARDQYIWFQTERFGGRFCMLTEPLIQYRIHSNQDSVINGGIMDLQLMDALLNEPYYAKKMENYQENIRQRIWIIYRLLSKKYHVGLLSKDEFDSFFDYKCVEFIKDTFPGKVRYMMMLALHCCPFFTGLAIKLILKIKK